MHKMKKFLILLSAAVAVGTSFASEPYRGLPSGYTQLEYLKSTKAQSINSEVVAKTSLRVEMDLLTPDYSTFIGTTEGTDSHDWRCFNHSSGMMFDCGSVRLIGSPLAFNVRYLVRFGQDDTSAYLKADRADGTPHCSLSTKKSTTAADEIYIALFGTASSLAPAFTPGNFGNVTLYSMKIADGETPVRDYVPAVDADGIKGLYDFVSGGFFTNVYNKGANTFTAGPEVHGMFVEPKLFYDTEAKVMKLQARVDRNDDLGDLHVVIADESGDRDVTFASAATPSATPYEYVFSDLPAGALVSVTMKTVCKGYAIEYPLGGVFNGGVTIRKGVDADSAESQVGTFVVALDDDLVAASDLAVAYTINDAESTAVAGQHYVPLSGVVTIPAGANSANVKVFPLYDASATEPKTLVVDLAPGSYFLSDPASAELSILNGNVSGFWQFDLVAGTLSDGIWRFACTAKELGLTVGAPQAYPEAISPLDFSKPIFNPTTGEECAIVSLNGMFNANGTAASKVGALTLPGESVTSIGGGAFRDCRNATGSIVLPSRLTKLDGAIFFHCANLKIDLNRMPQGITSVSPQVFGGCTGAFGDVDLPNVTAFDGRETFSGTAITSFRLGATIGTSSSQFFLGASGGQGCFQNCASLTNVVISAPQTITLHNFSGASYQSAFNGCSALETLDVSGFPNWNSPFQFTSCGKLTRVILGGVEMNTLASDAFKNLSALSEVVFKGVPPNDFVTPYLGTAGQKVTTVISLANMKTPNTSGKCWTDYAQGGAINHRSSTFAADYVTPDINLSLRPLITEESGEMEVETAIAYDLTETVWKLSVLVKEGLGDLTAIVTDESGTETRKTFAKDATPSDTPYVCAFEGLEAGATLKIALLIDCQGLTERKELGSIFNGGVSIVKGADADGAQPGTFTVALDDGLTVASDLTVAYTVNAASTALPGKSYVALPGVATIPAGANSGTITVIPLLDPVATGPVTLALDLAEGSYFISEPASAEISILNGNVSAPWFFNTEASTVSDGLWQFACTADKQGVTIGTVIAGPAELSPLDFSKPIVDLSGASHAIVELNPYFNNTALAKVIGELTLPGEGLKMLGNYAFYGAGNATGEILIPSTVETVGGFIFANCAKLTIDATKLPAGIKRVDACAFQSCKGMTGDVDLPSLEYMDGRSCFSGTGITSFRCGSPTLTGWNGTLSGGWNQGCFQNCTALTNVDFSAVQSGLVIDSGSAFAGCSSLKEIDLTGVTGINAFAVSGYFQGCTKLGKVTFGETFNSLHATTFRDCSTTISNIVFKGKLPDTFGISYLTNVTQKVTTTILHANKKVQNAKGLCWLDLAKDGQIRHKGTTFAADYVTPEIDLALRPLVVLEPDGLMMIIK